MSDQICPYTGLRSFSEDESLYFKGREEDIEQATSQLQKNKFLMLTGASGDGKSSLVFAGIIPNARAGFLKSKYTNWCVAGFRPERTPFQNLSASLARQLDIPNPLTVQGELNHGFSALVDLYKNSKRFIDVHSDSWLHSDEKERGRMKREAANLIILVDQFEELFTNPENYQQGVPSRDANLVLNILLETARIALEEDIPIYVIFTMRSDYIGQCAAFRGLPEYIGFSQFFVPRLNRSQLQQVVEEPAILSGNRISRRLTERLIHDLTEGVDQLPILQHALKQIWIAADNGNEEMDLIHYAMVGGMPVQELPDEQVERYRRWFALLPAEIKACYHAPNLQNVLDTHTNKLYQQAAGYYTTNTGNTISDGDAKSIIRIAFTCLTKIDQSRAVRNRMTLQEITNIVGNPDFDHTRVGAILNIFREPGNTFINPFINEENPLSQSLHPDSILDITHESLIRNWQYLGLWAKEEYDSHSVSLDFEKQLDRWVNSGKSNNFLLSIGPLTYFENWYKKARPNAWWIARYLPEETKKETKLDNARAILSNSQEFIRRSSRKHIVTRTIMRYGPKRIAMILGLIALLALTSFTIRNYIRKQNGYVLDNLKEQTLKLAGSPKADLLGKALAVIETLKSGQLTLDEVTRAIPDTLQRIVTLNGVAAQLLFQGQGQPVKETIRALQITDSLIGLVPVSSINTGQMSSLLREINLFRVALELGYFYIPDPRIDTLRKHNALQSGRWVSYILQKQPAGFQDIGNFTLALENAINYRAFSPQELKKITNTLSPFENGLQTEWLKSNFHRNQLMERGAIRQNYGFSHNGLYQELAYLYAAAGNSDKALQCIDTLLANSQNNFQGDYAAGGDNATNIAGVFFQYGQTTPLNSFVSGYSSRKKITQEEFYNRFLARTLHGLEPAGNLRLYPYMDETINLNLRFCSQSQLGEYYNKYREVVASSIGNENQKNFLLALSFKNEGILKSLYRKGTMPGDMSNKEYFDKALSLYRSVNPKFLDEQILVVDNALDQKILPRRYLFIYPDFRTPFHPSEPRSFFYFIFSDAFLRYILDNQLMDSLYPGAADLDYLSKWVEDYNTINISLPAFMMSRLPYSFLQKLEQSLSKQTNKQKLDLNELYLYLGKDAMDSGKTEDMVQYYNKIEPANIFNMLKEKSFQGVVNNQSFRLLGYAMEGYIKTGHLAKAYSLASEFKNPVNRSSLYSFAATQLLKSGFHEQIVRQVIDSALVEMSRKENRTAQQPNRRNIAFALCMEDPSGNVDQAYSLIRNLPEKLDAIQEICQSFAIHQNLYGAQMHIPEFSSPTDLAYFTWKILQGYNEGKGQPQREWEGYAGGYLNILNRNIVYVDEGN
jgi:hypothetical protein